MSKQPDGNEPWRKLLTAVNRWFDPTQALKGGDEFSLKYPVQPGPAEPDLTVMTRIEVEPDTPLKRLKVRAGAAADQVSKVLEQVQSDLTDDVALTLGRVKDALNADMSADVIVRPVTLQFVQPLQAYVVYIDGAANGQVVEEAILEPLLLLARGSVTARGTDLLHLVESHLVSNRQTEPVHQLRTIVEGVVSGQVALLLESAPGALLMEARNWPSRAVDKPITENVVKGPHEAFTENIRTNSALLRHRLMTPDLVFEPGQIGRRSRSYVYLAYIRGLANADLLAEVRRRLAAIDIDTLTDNGMLEQYLEGHQKTFFPTLGTTERPDRAAASISEGRVAILLDGSPYVLLVPWLFGDFFHNPEDYYIRPPFGTALRIVRITGAMITLLLPGLYIAIANYHHEMIPPSLLLAIAATREAVPFPAPLEVVMMELAFEIIREGSIRIPSVLGQTVGIVGALILGQAAVQAAIVSPILVIIVALTALGSFTIPNYEMGLVIRVLRFGFIFLATTFGLYGVAVGLLLISGHASAMRSFGVPFMAPLGPRLPGSPDTIIRGPLPAMGRRPGTVRPADRRRQAQGVTAGLPGKFSQEEASE
ncbi:MAG TPA: spore germination protein [Symbiobacteriaceae bacterium]|nr:spore germination protein [Symbiobacteriaceae bacterium]